MKKILLLFIVLNSSFSLGAYAEKPHARESKKNTEEEFPKPDTAVTGIYITSIHDIDLSKNYDAHALGGYGTDSLSGWIIDPDSFKISIGQQKYETAFDDTVAPHTAYSSYKVKIGITHRAWGLFWKIFLGMYISFLISA